MLSNFVFFLSLAPVGLSESLGQVKQVSVLLLGHDSGVTEPEIVKRLSNHGIPVVTAPLFKNHTDDRRATTLQQVVYTELVVSSVAWQGHTYINDLCLQKVKVGNIPVLWSAHETCASKKAARRSLERMLDELIRAWNKTHSASIAHHLSKE